MTNSVKARLQVVEDEALVARDLSVRLQKMGYEVIATCNTPHKAIDTALEEKPDLILMDINLNAEIDGIEVAELIHQQQDTPIIFCTAYSGADVYSRAKITEPYGYILKPIDDRELEINIEIALYKYKIEHHLHDINNKLNLTLDSINDGVIACNEFGFVFLMNTRAYQLCNRCQPVDGVHIDDIIRLSDINTEVEHIDIPHLLKERMQSQIKVEQRLKISQNETLPIELCISPLNNKNKEFKGLIFVFRDISRRLFIERELKINALQDPVTHLPERTLLIERISLELQRQKENPSYKFAVAFFDIDRFRSINEGLSYEFGDELLRRLSERIQNAIGGTDMVSRFNADVFVCLFDDINNFAELVSVVNKITKHISRPIVIDTHHIQLSVSTGIALSAEHYHQASEILRDADIAMSKAKQNGVNSQVIFDEEMHSIAQKTIELEEEMREGLQAREFLVYFQPIINARNYMLTHFEALVRWRHPHKGLIPPNEFIPVAEDGDLIIQIGDFVLEKVCQQIQLWQRQFNSSVKVAVNLSAKQFNQPQLLERIEHLLLKYDVSATSLVLEVTESMAMNDIERNIKILTALRRLGISISIDDFGTGYSSLSYLKRLPIHTLKIDRSFVIDIRQNSDDRAIVKAIVAMAKELHIDVLVEGIEDTEQLKILHGLGCDYYQGFYFSKPLPEAKATALLQSGGNYTNLKI
ncbi:EAL domain-containing protein [Pseudoalteromonas sp.]|uniref:GGDEF domain-containing response regulator n=1 Tax=Pseudoalteromonas sp. TaxID=53249 RepID=UPI0035649B31